MTAPLPEMLGPDRLARRGLKLAHLRLIAVLAESGQISAAAAQLAISQPAASRLLGELSTIVGAPLYRRHPRGIVLSELGLLLAERARTMLRDLDATDRELAEMHEGARGRVIIGSVTGPSLELVLPVLRQFRLTMPGIESTIVVDTSDKLAELLLAERLDFYIGRIPQDADHGAFASRPLEREQVGLVVREGHPLLRMKSLTLKACIDYDWILQAPGGLLRHTMENYLLDRGIALPHRVTSTSSTLMTLALVARSNAIAPISRPVAAFFGGSDGLSGRIATLPIADDLSVEPYAVLNLAGRRLSAAAARFHEAILTFAQERATEKMAEGRQS